MMDNMIDMPEQATVVGTPAQASVMLCAGIPWTNDYNHVRLFDSKNALHSFVASKAVKQFTSSTPVRWGNLDYRAEGNESALIEINYIAFRNYPDNTQWYYGFVTSVEWLSSNSCRIHFEPDYWQNNIYDVTINSCFVEREHVAPDADIYYNNLVPEGLETGEYKATGFYQPTTGGWHFALLASANSEGGQPIPVWDHSIYTGLQRYVATSYTDMTTILNNFQSSGIADSIVQVFQYPAMCDTTELKNQRIDIPKLTNIDGYTPKNKKLFQYPYCYVLFTNPSNKTATFRFELTSDTDLGLHFDINSIAGLAPMIHVSPYNYRKSLNGSNIPPWYDDIYIDASIQCAWTNDAYQAYISQMSPIWEAQEKQVAVGQVSTAFNGIVSTIGGLLSGNILGGLASGANAIYNSMTAPYLQQTNMQAQKESHDLIPPSSRGSISGNASVAMYSTNYVNFFVMSITAQMARCIDDYFTAFGYATNRIKTPNINNRPSWNFVKTNGASFSGSIMLDDMRKLQAIFDRGVTIWHTNDVGNYNLDNQ